MKNIDTSWRIFGIYLLVIVLMCICGKASGQISVSQFNAEWNNANAVDWIQDLSDCETVSYIDIMTSPKMQKRHKIAVIPTIIIFKDGIEVARFQADLSFKMLAKLEDVQEEIDNQLMSDF